MLLIIILFYLFLLNVFKIKFKQREIKKKKYFMKNLRINNFKFEFYAENHLTR